MATMLMADLSHWNSGVVDFAKYPWHLVGLKVTDGAFGVDPTYAVRVKDAHTPRGIRRKHVGVLHYHFGEAGDARAQAQAFVTAVSPHWLPGDRVVIDAETKGVDGAFVNTFIAEVTALRPTWAGLVYGSPYYLRDNNIKPSHGWALWLADYAAAWVFIPPGWTEVSVWQYSDAATCAGVEGKCDMSKVLIPPLAPEGLSALTRRLVKHLIKRLNARKHPLSAGARVLLTRLVKAINRVLEIKQ